MVPSLIIASVITWLPIFNFIISSNTISNISISSSCPSLITVTFLLAITDNLSITLFEFISCIILIIVITILILLLL